MAKQKCTVDDCEKFRHAHGYCVRHYGYWRRNGDPLKKIKTGRHTTAQGYIIIWRPGEPGTHKNTGRILEHRWVMQQVLGRALEPKEQVHHLNGDRSDNRPENLELWLTGQPTGARVNDQIEWAKEIMRLYPKEFK